MSEAESTKWARAIARAYVEACHFRPSEHEETSLAGNLETVLSECTLLAIPPNDWPPFHLNPAIETWERMFGRASGPRVERVDYASDRVEMRGPFAP